MVFEVMALTGILFAALGVFCRGVRVGGRLYRGISRGVSAVWVLFALSLVPGLRIGVNLMNISVLSALGLPGCVLLQVIAMMP